jgi:hypothetical protein
MAPMPLDSLSAVRDAFSSSAFFILATAFLKVVFAPKRLIVLSFWVTEGRSGENRSKNFLAMSNLIG